MIQGVMLRACKESMMARTAVELRIVVVAVLISTLLRMKDLR